MKYVVRKDPESEPSETCISYQVIMPLFNEVIHTFPNEESAEDFAWMMNDASWNRRSEKYKD